MEVIKERQMFLFLLALSVAFFIRKGIQYCLLESYTPLLVVFFMALGLFTYFFKNKKLFSVAVAVWSIFLVLWSLARFVILLLFYIMTETTEAHIREQLTPLELLVSLLFFTLGVYFWRQRKTDLNLSLKPS